MIAGNSDSEYKYTQYLYNHIDIITKDASKTCEITFKSISLFSSP